MPKLNLFLQNGSQKYAPSVKDEIVWETELRGTPGKLTFSVLKDSALDFQEGNQVSLAVDGTDTFFGFVFTKKRSKDGLIQVTAYDQLRYLKNKCTLQYQNKSAAGLLRMLARDFKLTCGTVEETGYLIPNRVEDSQTLLDVMQHALDDTLQYRNQLYVLYDDYGKLTLKNFASMKVDRLIYQNSAEDFDYTSSIDSDTYDLIHLIYKGQDGAEKAFQAKDDQAVKQWGILQYEEKLDDPQNGQQKANTLLSLYGSKTRSLSVSKALGDIRVRGGSSVPVTLDLGDVVANTYMVAEKVKHTLTADTHFMDVTLIGGGKFNA